MDYFGLIISQFKCWCHVDEWLFIDTCFNTIRMITSEVPDASHIMQTVQCLVVYVLIWQQPISPCCSRPLPSHPKYKVYDIYAHWKMHTSANLMTLHHNRHAFRVATCSHIKIWGWKHRDLLASLAWRRYEMKYRKGFGLLFQVPLHLPPGTLPSGYLYAPEHD